MLRGGDDSRDDEKRMPVSGYGVGALLRSTREEYGLELSDVAAVLRIRQDYLGALEANEPASLPAPAYAIGFLRAYGDYLGLDSGELVRRFKKERADLTAQPELNFPVPLTERGIPGSSIILVALIVGVIGYVSWNWYSDTPRGTVALVDPVPARLLPPPPNLDPPAVSPDSAAAAEPRPAPSSAPATVAPAPSSAPATVAPAAPVAANAAAPVQLAVLPPPTDPLAVPTDHVFGSAVPGQVVVKATSDSWVEVLDNDHPIWSRLLKAGDIYNPPKDGLTMLVGNAGGIEVTVNGKLLPAIGNPGEVRRLPLDAAKLAGG
jgi:cytoskeleton protein RodZ